MLLLPRCFGRAGLLQHWPHHTISKVALMPSIPRHRETSECNIAQTDRVHPARRGIDATPSFMPAGGMVSFDP